MGEPWLAIIGLGEDGLAGLPDASRDALARAEVVFGGQRHLDLVQAGTRGQPWLVPFDTAPVLALRGRRVAVLASGDPFWFGAGGSLAADLTPADWVAHPAPSTFALAAARLGWRLEEVTCLGLHAQPLPRARPHLTQGTRQICLMRDGAAVAEFAAYLCALDLGPSTLTILERLGGAQERIRQTTAAAAPLVGIAAPVAVAVEVAGGKGLPRGFGLPDDLFAHDGQITRAAVRAITLAALSPRPGARLWDIGAGSGSVSVEWCLAGGAAYAIEPCTTRLANIATNAAAFGVDHRMVVLHGAAPKIVGSLPPPNAVFLGGGCSEAVLQTVWQAMPDGARLVANAVTLETEALLAVWHAARGGTLLRIELAEATPLGPKRGWTPGRPIVQWSVTR